MKSYSSFAVAGALAAAVACGLVPWGTAAFAADEGHTEHGAHQHGHGSFEMAIEKTAVSIELRAPGVDIVGFEHPAATDQEKAAVEAAKAKLAEPLAMFGLPKEAQCVVNAVDVHVHEGAHDDDDKPGKDGVTAAKDSDPAKGSEHAHDHGHSNFHAKYTLTCSTPQAIKSLDFAFFAAFAGAQELEVIAVSEKGQVKAEATRKAPKVPLRGLW